MLLFITATPFQSNESGEEPINLKYHLLIAKSTHTYSCKKETFKYEYQHQQETKKNTQLHYNKYHNLQYPDTIVVTSWTWSHAK